MNKKTRSQRYNKLPGDGEPWALNIITENLEQKKNTSLAPAGQATDKKLRPNQLK